MKLSWVFVAVATTLFVQNVMSNTISTAEERLVAAITEEVDILAKTGVVTEKLKAYLADLAFPTVKRSTDLTNYIEQRSSLTCTLCTSLVNVIMGYRKIGMAEETIISTITTLCVNLNIEGEDVCRGVIELNAPIAFYIVDHKPSLAAASVCGIVLQSSSCPLTDEEFEWTVEVDDSEPVHISSEETEETFRIVQISDPHYDPVYEAYGNAYCDEPTCCRVGQNDTNTSGAVAGYWGDYNDCDSPWYAITDTLDQIKRQEQEIEYVYFTGDIIDHGVWETTREGNIESIKKTFKQLYETFGSVPVYPIFGNHEPNPTNVFAPSDVTDDEYEVSTSWLYELSADIWIQYGWLPESTRSTILEGGYYTLSPKTGFRIIALNNNICYVYNWWLLYEPQDPSGQLKWLADTLLQAEIDGEFVHILAHVPPGTGSCQYTWGREYRKIINRFAHIIPAEFNGHSHNDEIRIIYDLENTTEAIRVAWNGGSISTYSDVNPNYKVYSVNANNYRIEDVDTWIYNLTLANETPDKNPAWFKSYSFKEQYGLEDLSLTSLNDLVLRMANNRSIISTYYGHFVKQSDPGLESGCSDSCLTNQLCKIVTAVADDSTQCDYFTSLA
ncbi:sphingomyelin phosphodiesterase-like [Diprion similis]|uniref:sphingomyelin phosphodiesterase-like n=1 Tax=Diprion similis TaxID=362088 RepID=UPI001EF980B9|nr:sphingomyelin phosphodiesterase-like [Diprion similis]